MQSGDAASIKQYKRFRKIQAELKRCESLVLLSNCTVLFVSLFFFVLAFVQLLLNAVPLIAFIAVIADDVNRHVDSEIIGDASTYSVIIDSLVMTVSAMGIALASLGFLLRKRKSSLKLAALINRFSLSVMLLFVVVQITNFFLASTYITILLANMR